MREKLVILGAGESGVGAAKLAVTKNYDVFLSDAGIIKPEYVRVLEELGIDFEIGQHSFNKILDADLVVKSPGIPNSVEIIRRLSDKNIPVISEIEFAYKFYQGKTVCITGSNGKTTTTLMIYHILKNAGLNVGLAGNVGKSFAILIAEGDYDYVVLELSSFQLDECYDFKANVAVLLNITPDHLNRYDNKMENYIKSKFRISRNQTENDVLIVPDDDPVVKENMKYNSGEAKVWTFGKTENASAYIEDDKIKINKDINTNSIIMDTNFLKVKGVHNRQNAMAASLSSLAVGVSDAYIRESLETFSGVEHRFEYVRTHKDVKYYNDSKATNVNSAWYALESSDDPVVWIVGGVDKGNDYSQLLTLVDSKVKAIICLGVDNKKIVDAFEAVNNNIVECSSMEEAVKAASCFAESGDTVLLSPACASFDLFENYEDRGNQFKQEVKKL
ncbi:MAG: UDP-N-acetylmuramoyl-L-alanine--D-glutamate ligase [Bacteroidales bacterium]